MSNYKVGTKLDRLNYLLKRNKDLKIPDFRRTISSSFSNHQWLKKALKDCPDEEIVRLLNLSQHQLLEPEV